MLRILLKIFLLLFFCLCCGSSLWARELEPIAELTLAPEDRILVLAPHPDDEVLGVGGVIQRAASMKLPMKIAFLTYGDNNQWSFLVYRKHPVIMPGAIQSMGLIRKDEAITASSLLGVKDDKLVFLGYPDFGSLNIWYMHWNKRPPYRSLLTWATNVPYQGALRPGAAFKGEEIVADLRSIIRDFKPTKIFVSHPSDHNGDHLALYLYMKVALWDEGMSQAEVYPYLIHYLAWPKQKGFKPEYSLLPPLQLNDVIKWVQFRLTPQEMELKKAALQAHKSQYESSMKYLLSFIRNNEIFGDFSKIQLHPNQSSSVFRTHRNYIPASDLPEELNSREKTSFIGVEWKFVKWEGSDLIVSIELSKPLAKDVEAFIYIFGYSQKTAFEKMPKISLRLGSASHTLYDQAKRIEHDSIRVKRTANEVTLAVPLQLLGNPDKILTSARTYLGNVPLDSASWIAVELE